jgi:hypothetical protein
MLTRRFTVSLSSVVLLSALSATARAVITADSVVSYDPGAGAKTAYWGAPLDNPAAALGLPASNHDVPDTFDGDNTQITYADHSVLSPFNAAYAPDEVVSFGAGGHLTLHLSAPVTTGGVTLGVHTGTGLNSVLFSNGQNLDTADVYTDRRVAVVDVSADNDHWFSLGSVTFELPSNYYSAGLTGPYVDGPGTAVADFAQPFTGHLSDFDGRDWQGTLDVLAGSAGGTWLDLSGIGAPASIQYVRFSLPANSANTFVLDSLTAVPEPASLALISLGAPLLLRRRRTR